MPGMPRPPIRAARPNELEDLRQMEHETGVMFAEVGMGEIADHDPPPAQEFVDAIVAVDSHDRPIGYLRTKRVDDCLHIEQVTVALAHARRGIGAALIDRAVEIAHADGRPALTLTTFTEVPWNMPYYERLGFTVIAPLDQGPELAALVADEARQIPGGHPRVAMRRPVRLRPDERQHP